MAQRELRNNDVLEEVLKRNADTVYRIAYMRVRNPHDAEDITQDVLVRYIRFKPQFESAEHEKAWFIRSAVNQTKSFFTTAHRRHDVPLDENSTAGAESGDPAEENEVLNAVMALPENMRTVIHLYYYENMSVKEVSQACGKSVSAVKSLLLRGRRVLKEALTGTVSFERDENDV